MGKSACSVSIGTSVQIPNSHLKSCAQQYVPVISVVVGRERQTRSFEGPHLEAMKRVVEEDTPCFHLCAQCAFKTHNIQGKMNLEV